MRCVLCHVCIDVVRAVLCMGDSVLKVLGVVAQCAEGAEYCANWVLSVLRVLSVALLGCSVI
jgi:nicotinamide riboside transporter PnuC